MCDICNGIEDIIKGVIEFHSKTKPKYFEECVESDAILCVKGNVLHFKSLPNPESYSQLIELAEKSNSIVNVDLVPRKGRSVERGLEPYPYSNPEEERQLQDARKEVKAKRVEKCKDMLRQYFEDAN